MLACLFFNHATASYPRSKMAPHLSSTYAFRFVRRAVTLTSLVSRALPSAHHAAHAVAATAIPAIAPPGSPSAAVVVAAPRRPVVVAPPRVHVVPRAIVPPRRPRAVVARRRGREDVTGVARAARARIRRRAPRSGARPRVRRSQTVCAHSGRSDDPRRPPSDRPRSERMRKQCAMSFRRRRARFERPARRATRRRAMGDRDAKRQRGARRPRAQSDDMDDLLGAAGVDARDDGREDDDDRGRAIDGDDDDDDDGTREASDGRRAEEDASGSDSRAKGARDGGESGETRREEDDEGGRDPGREDDDDDEDVMDAECGEEEEGSDGDAREEDQGNKTNARKRGRKPKAANEEGARGDADAEASLPKRTEVTITGNARTKAELIGMKGVVKKSLPSGGWHRLVLENGREVRVRRSALTASETGRGDEEGEQGEDDDDEDDEDEDDGDDKDNMATRARRPTRVPGNGPPSQAAAAAMKRLQERRRSARPNCQSNFERLTLSTLQKYKKAYEMEANPETDGDKNALVHEVGKHFMQQKLDEQKVLQAFMCAVADTTQIG